MGGKAPARGLGISPGSVARRRRRQTVEDRKTGATEPRATVLGEEDEPMIVAFRWLTLLPPDDCLDARNLTRRLKTLGG